MSRTTKKSTTALFALVVLAAAAMLLVTGRSEAANSAGGQLKFSIKKINNHMQIKVRQNPYTPASDVECNFYCLATSTTTPVHQVILPCELFASLGSSTSLAPYFCPDGTTALAVCVINNPLSC